jgi:hypothetical protein
MSDEKVGGRLAGRKNGGDVPPNPPNAPDSPPPDDPPQSPLLQALTLQRVALAVFAGLALAIVLVTLVALLIPQDEQKSLAISRTMTVLLITALACAAIAWFDRTNSMMLGRGVRHLLSIQRAAVASFVGASVATVGVAIFVALSALFAGGLEKGLYALASIEFLLKLAAVSAIIVLMTLRKPLVTSVAPPRKQGEGDDDSPPTVEVDREDNGRLEFGGLSFAFSLVVIAALIVPGEDLMRMASMFFGGQDKLEQYLPTRPVVTVEDDLSNQIARAVVQSIAARQMFADLSLPELEREIDSLALQNQIFGVIANNLINNVERRGALTLLREVCDDNEDTLIFANSDDRVLAEHIAFLAAEGLIDQPYGDLNSIEITSYGSSVVKNSTGGNCKDTASTVELAVASTDDPTITTAPFETTLTLPNQGSVFALELPPDRYRAELVAIDRTDPVLELLNTEGAIIQRDDDGGPGFLDAGLDFVVATAGQSFILRASTIGGQGGRASLRLFRAPPPESNFPSPTGLVDRLSQIDTSADMRVIGAVPHNQPLSISSEGTVLELDLDSGTFKISLSAVGDADPILELFDAAGNLLEESDDATGINAALTVTFTEGDRFFIRASNYRGVPGDAVLYVDHAPADPGAVVVLERPPVPLVETAEIPPSGMAFFFEALTTGDHRIHTARPTGSQGADDDLVAVLFRGTAGDYSQIASDDDSGLDRFPVISARLTAGETYLLVLRHYGENAKATPVAISVTPRVSVAGANAVSAQAPADTPAATEQEATSPPATIPTDSGGSQSNP